jgi:hypothetical protein
MQITQGVDDLDDREVEATSPRHVGDHAEILISTSAPEVASTATPKAVHAGLRSPSHCVRASANTANG